MDQLDITARPRTVFGKKVSHLRQQGLVPANIYGHGITSTPIEVEVKPLEQAIGRAGTSTLVRLRLPTEKAARRVLVRDIRRDPVSGRILHVDFYQVSMTEKLKAEVHLTFVGEPPAAKVDNGLLVRALTSVEVECLPGDLPESITVDVSRLETTDDTIHVRDLAIPSGVTVLASPDELVAKVVPIRAEREEEVAAPEAPPPQAPPPPETAEGAATAEA